MRQSLLRIKKQESINKRIKSKLKKTMRKQSKYIENAQIFSNEEIVRDAEHTDHFIMELIAPQISKHASPGQFVTVKVQENTTEPLLRIPLGIHDNEIKDTNKKGIKLLYKVVGDATFLLSKKKQGETINVLGPLGNGFCLDEILFEKGQTAIIIAGGHGVAPLYFLAKEIIKQREQDEAFKGNVEVFLGAATKEHVICRGAIGKFCSLGTDTIHVATEDGTQGSKGYIPKVVDRYLKKQTTDHCSRSTIYSCGPKPMLAEVARLADKYNIKAYLSLDAYMACGIGACLGCAVSTREGYKMVCKDGPVFSAEEINWEKELQMD
ncbi:MAG: dihydroorotate dehydrogenase electron transfer subunit [Candidatus Omnitrophota bacterium]